MCMFQVLIPKLKDPDPNPGVLISVLLAIGEQAQVCYIHLFVVIFFLASVLIVESYSTE